jgi:dolichyl-phosphate-mannose-protein mannosyltransferase
VYLRLPLAMKLRWGLMLLLAASAATHLFQFGYPREVVFDEVHFGKFITAYCCTGERFFDIHPPHAKLLIAGVAWLGGFRGGFDFDHIGQAYPSDVPLWALRLVPLLVGVLLPLIMYGVARELGVGPRFAFLIGWLAVFDGALVVQTRYMLLDGTLLVATFGSLYCFLRSRKSSSTKQWLWLINAGVLAGLAAGTKFTGLAALGLIGVMIAVEVVRRLNPLHLPLVPAFAKASAGTAGGADPAAPRGALTERSGDKRRVGGVLKTFVSAIVILSTATFIYLAGWVVHFALLPLPGSGDAWRTPHFNQATLVTDFFRETYQLHRIMLEANYNLTATHPDASVWWSWPFMQKSVFYWQGTDAVIYFLGNPIVWWGGTFLFLVTLIVTVIEFGQRQPRTAADGRTYLWIPVVGFLIALSPLMRVPRALFLYHYLTPLLFSLLAGAVWLERIASDRGAKHFPWFWYGAGLALAVAGFAFFSPLVYGFAAPPDWSSWLFWFPGWR